MALRQRKGPASRLAPPPGAGGLAALTAIAALVTVSASAEDQPGAAGSATATGSGSTAGGIIAPTIAPTIASISIDNGNIFDLDDPEENGLFYRLANRLHIKTQESVIRQQLLFHEGDPLSAQSLEESERILRDNRFLQDAEIEYARNDDGFVDVSVATSDVWTLMPRANLSRAGGVNRFGFGLKETNLLGKGMAIEASLQSDVDRESLEFGFADRNLGDSWYSIDASLGLNSDGHSHHFRIGQPFYSLDATRANGIAFEDTDRIDYFYDGGEIQSSYRLRYQSAELFLGRSEGLVGDWTRRYLAGVGYDRHRFDEDPDTLVPGSPLPEDRTFLYPFVGIELVEDRYEETRNVSQIQRVEDHHLGTRIAARVGLAGASFGSDRTAALVSGSARTGFGSFERRALMLSAAYSARFEDGGMRNQQLDADARYFWRQSGRMLFFAGLSGSVGDNLDLDNQVLLGGDSGLRGYPLRYLSGDSRVLLTLEQRVFTDWYPFHLFHVGGAVFFDAGRVWDSRYPSDRNDSVHRDIGIGLRLGSTRSGLAKVIHIDLAYPLDGDGDISSLQVLVQTRSGF